MEGYGNPSYDGVEYTGGHYGGLFSVEYELKTVSDRVLICLRP